uniref:Response regulator n=1 Tax=Desulfatirhabdium butyrativorans TaxID=340467 RepID=A0A7C4RN87_9BACT
MHILIVDDEVIPLMHLQEAFQKEGFDVTTAVDAPSALQAIQGSHFDACLLDLNLPGMNGIELAKAILALMPKAYLIAVTGYPDRFEFQDCLNAGFKGYFAKPLHAHVLIDTIRQIPTDNMVP